MKIGITKTSQILILSGCIALGVAAGFIPSTNWQCVVNVITTIGTYTSVVAFVVMLKQFESVRQTTEKVKFEVGRTATIADLSQYAECMRTVYDDIYDHEYKLAIFKLRSVREALLLVKSKIGDTKKKYSYTRIISTIATTISALQNVNKDDSSLNLGQIQKDLDNISLFLEQEKVETAK